MIIDKIGDILHTEADVICQKNNTELTRKSVGNMAVQILVK